MWHVSLLQAWLTNFLEWRNILIYSKFHQKAGFKCHAKLIGYLHFHNFWDLKIILRQKAMPRGELRMAIRTSWGPIACFITAAHCSKIGLRISIRKIFTFLLPEIKRIFRSSVSEFLTSTDLIRSSTDLNWDLRSNFWTQLKLLRVICWDLYSVLLFTFLLTTVFPLALLFITLSTK